MRLEKVTFMFTYWISRDKIKYRKKNTHMLSWMLDMFNDKLFSFKWDAALGQYFVSYEIG